MKEKNRLSIQEISDIEVLNYLYAQHDTTPLELFDLSRTSSHQRHEIINSTFKRFTKCGFNERGKFLSTYSIPGTEKRYTVEFDKVKSYQAVRDINKLVENINRTRKYREQMRAKSTFLYYSRNHSKTLVKEK